MIKLMQGDCLEMMKTIPDGSVDLVLTDPPYGTTACKWDSVIPLEPMWKELKRITKPTSAIVLFGSQPFTTTLIASNMSDFRYEWIWYKNSTSGFALAKKQPMRCHENVLVFYKKQPTYNYIKEPRDMNAESVARMEYEFSSVKGNNQLQNGITKVQFIPESKTMAYPKSVQKVNTIPNNHKDRVHPTQKPVALLEYLIKTYSNAEDVILDFTIGSGSTGVACVNLGRKFIGIEKDEGYFKIAEERINAAIKDKVSE